ncbi:oxidoreductase-like domain-containing protein 1 [Fopius arisanus]|uniref:Oxidoreductase-like domain-containing protein 1 n=1 Tax=Fopius arisanus TaxID=64838 RepID=A0A9R1U603_9HYME|nr:PREDICTED: oxidoreductase-like domain-containing protein 1 [Fopius arisanus]
MATLTRLMESTVYPRVAIIKSCRRKLSGGNTDDKGRRARRPVLRDNDVVGQDGDDLKEPTNCCMRGCANCVWIRYAEKLSKKLADSNADVQKIIIDKVKDPNMKAFLSMELRCRKIS